MQNEIYLGLFTHSSSLSNSYINYYINTTIRIIATQTFTTLFHICSSSP